MKRFKLRLSFILLLSVVINLSALPLINLTQKEQIFIKNHSSIVLGINQAWDPNVIVNDDGTYSGIESEILNLFNEISGANFKLKVDEWSKILQQAKNKNIDGLTTSAVFKQREKYFSFSKSYINTQKLIITTIEKSSCIQEIEDLEYKTIGVHESNLVDNKIAKRFTKSKIIRFKTYKELIISVAIGKVDAMIGSIAIPYNASKMDISNLKATIGLDEVVNLVFSIRKDYPEAISIINKCLDHIGKEKILAIKNKWYQNTLNTMYNIKQKLLNSEENNYLLNKGSISMCIDPNWLPFESFDKNNKYIGLTTDYFKLFQKELPIKIKIIKTNTWEESLEFSKNRKCDILSLAMPTPKRKEYLNFTSPYLTIPLVMATKYDKQFMDDFSTLTTKKLGITKGYAFIEILKVKYPNLNIIEVENIEDGLKQVINGKLYGYIGTLASVGYQFQKNFAGELKIAGKFNEKWNLGIAVRNDDKILLDIFEKLIQNIDEKTKEDILNSWISIKYEKGIDYTLIWQILAIVFILAIFVIWYQRKLIVLNNTLEQRVKEKVKESQDKDKMLFQQNKLASMGEMIANIAHQWRQPIATLNGIYLNMEMDYEDKKLDKKTFNSYLNQLEDVTQYMSSTIEYFTDFSKPNKMKEDFNINDLLTKAKTMLEKYLKDSNITIDLELDNTIVLNSYPAVLMQVVFTLVYNAKDAFSIEKIDKCIKIILYKENDKIFIKVQDNAGGIKTENLEKIFDPYFTTKHKSKGTGLGLYIANEVVRKSLDGILSVKNNSNGAVFTVEL